MDDLGLPPISGNHHVNTGCSMARYGIMPPQVRTLILMLSRPKKVEKDFYLLQKSLPQTQTPKNKNLQKNMESFHFPRPTINARARRHGLLDEASAIRPLFQLADVVELQILEEPWKNG